MKLCGRKPKLTREQVQTLRRWAEVGRSAAAIARKWGVSETTVQAYLRGERKWAA